MTEPTEGKLTVVVSQVRWEAAGVVALTLMDSTGTPLPLWEPGAHVELTLPSGMLRQYSLCGDPNDTTGYTVAVRLEQHGRGGSAEVHNTALIGRELTMSAPRNRFPLHDATEYLFIAGGIGITAILPMATAVASARQSNWLAIYCGRDSATMAFRSRLEALAPEQVTIVDTAVDERPNLKQEINQLPEGAVVYCCGPSALIDAVTEVCASTTVSCVTERFGADPSAVPPIVSGSDQPFDIELRRSGISITVPADVTVLQALRDAGVEADSSCEEGNCGTCEVKVLEGAPDHRDTVLSQREKQANTCMMPCVSRACTSTLALDL